jgi:hypothetical protein
VFVALSGDNTPQGFSSSEVVLWDSKYHQELYKIQFDSHILDLIFYQAVLIVVESTKISFIDTCGFKLKYSVNTPEAK